MSESDRFHLLRRESQYEGRRTALLDRKIPATLGDLAAAAPFYRPSAALEDAINVALAVGSPLLLVGEPGTGKTQVAWYLGWYFRQDEAAPPKPAAESRKTATNVFELPVRSDSAAGELLYTFDAVGYLHNAQTQKDAAALEPKRFRRKGPLWQAYEATTAGAAAVVLIDEIDKAPRDFPNDLLHVLDQHQFDVAETGERVSRPEGTPPPVVVITSNAERRLPAPFLRRCVFHQIAFSEDLVREAVETRRGDSPHLDDDARQVAVARFFELRNEDLRKVPATAELLAWLVALSTLGGITANRLRDAAYDELPALSALIKDRDDLALLLG